MERKNIENDYMEKIERNKTNLVKEAEKIILGSRCGDLYKQPEYASEYDKNVQEIHGKDLENYLLQGPPGWMHWLRADALNALVEWTQQELEKRYEFD